MPSLVTLVLTALLWDRPPGQKGRNRLGTNNVLCNAKYAKNYSVHGVVFASAGVDNVFHLREEGSRIRVGEFKGGRVGLLGSGAMEKDTEIWLSEGEDVERVMDLEVKDW